MGMRRFFRNLRKTLRQRAYLSAKTEADVVNRFHTLYYDAHAFGKTWTSTFWQGVEAEKCPLDLWIYQETVFDLRPDVILETGTRHGGSALFLAHMCDLVNNGRVITIDIEDKKGRPQHERIQYLLGSSVDEEVVARATESIGENDKVMVLLDSDHKKDHVLQELRIYSRFVTKDSYLIVEDTNINGHPVAPDFGPGPMEALDEFLKETDAFVIDESKEKFFLTFNPRGHLKRIK